MARKQQGAVPANPTTSTPGDATSAGTAGQAAALADHRHAREATPVATYVYSFSGVLSVYTSTIRFHLPQNKTCTSVRATVGTAPTGASIIVDVQQSGTTLWPTTPANRPTIAAGTNTATGVPDTTALISGDYLTVSILQVGSTFAGAALTVQVYVQ